MVVGLILPNCSTCIALCNLPHHTYVAKSSLARILANDVDLNRSAPMFGYCIQVVTEIDLNYSRPSIAL